LLKIVLTGKNMGKYNVFGVFLLDRDIKISDY
jgi:hypothetical protein